MSEIMLILRREFLERVRTRGFVLGTILFPAFMAAVLIVPVMLEGGTEERRFAVVDEAPAGITERFVQTLTTPPEGAETSRYRVEVHNWAGLPGTRVDLTLTYLNTAGEPGA